MSTKQSSTRMVVVVAAYAAFLATFNETFLNVAFTPIMLDLSVDVATVQWLATAYMLGAAVMVPVSSFLYRSIPTKKLFVGTTVLFIVGSIVGMIAPNFTVLLIGRIIQSLGSGMIVPISMNVVLEVAPRKRLGAYMGIMGAMTTLGPSLSLVMAGGLLTFFTWRALLLVFGLLSIVCLVMGARLLGNIAKLTNPRLDAFSVALISLALIGLLYGLSTIFSGSLFVAGIAFVLGAACLILFGVRQGKIEQPLINLKPFGNPAFAVGVLMNVLTLIMVFALNIVVPLFLQSQMGVSSLGASLTIFPAILFTCILAPIAGRLYDQHGAKPMLALGFACSCAAVLGLSQVVAGQSLLAIALVYIPVIGGTAFIIGPVQSFALSRLDPSLNVHGVTILSTGFQVAGCIGSSLFTGIYAAGLASSAASSSPDFQAACDGFFVMSVAVAACAFAGAIAGCLLKTRSTAAAEAKPKAEQNPLMQIMKHDIYVLQGEDKVLDAIRMFVDKGISGMPVVDSFGVPVGFVSDGDVMRYLSDQTPAFKNQYSFLVESRSSFDDRLAPLMETPVSEICGEHVVSVDVRAGLGEVCRVLASHHLKKVPVLDGKTMVGVINRSNITRYSMNGYLEGQS